MGFSFYFSSLYPSPYIELYVCLPISISYLNFRVVLVLPKMAGSAQTHKSMSFIWIVWSTLYVYLCQKYGFCKNNASFRSDLQNPYFSTISKNVDHIVLSIHLLNVSIIHTGLDYLKKSLLHDHYFFLLF